MIRQDKIDEERKRRRSAAIRMNIMDRQMSSQFQTVEEMTEVEPDGHCYAHHWERHRARQIAKSYTQINSEQGKARQ